MSNDSSSTATNSLKPGDKIELCNRNPDATEIVIEDQYGLQIRFNLPVGHAANVVAGNANLKIYLNECNEQLIGIPEQD